MKSGLVVIMLAVAVVAQAQVHVWTEPDGTKRISNVGPVPDGAEEVRYAGYKWTAEEREAIRKAEIARREAYAARRAAELAAAAEEKKAGEFRESRRLADQVMQRQLERIRYEAQKTECDKLRAQGKRCY